MRSIAWPWLQEKRCPAFELWKSSGSICGRFQHQIASKRDEVLGISILLVYFGRQREYSREKERGKRDKVAKTNANSKNTKSSWWRKERQRLDSQMMEKGKRDIENKGAIKVETVGRYLSTDWKKFNFQWERFLNTVRWYISNASTFVGLRYSYFINVQIDGIVHRKLIPEHINDVQTLLTNRTLIKKACQTI